MNQVDVAMQITDAQLPAAYEQARTALAQCVEIDECVDWADKAAALASYARQADDKTMENYAMRIRSRAIRRAGELLKEYDGRGRPTENTDTTVGNLSQSAAAQNAGMSERQQLTAVRVAKVPHADFEAAVESASPPTITALAESGKQARPQAERPAGFVQATTLIGTMSRFADFCAANDAKVIARAILPHETETIRNHISPAMMWLAEFMLELENQKRGEG